MYRHIDTFLQLNQLGQRMEYQPTFGFPSYGISPFHSLLRFLPPLKGRDIVNPAWLPEAVRGYLTVEDAMKLYEMAYFSIGGILELGCCFGLSTCIMGQANVDREHPQESKYYPVSSKRVALATVDIDPRHIHATAEALIDVGVEYEDTDKDGFVELYTRDAVEFLSWSNDIMKRKYGFVFVDHDHRYQSNYEVCQLLSDAVMQGGFVLFHDYNDKRNASTKSDEYRVYQAVRDGLDKEAFVFWGIYGCSALYRRA